MKKRIAPPHPAPPPPSKRRTAGRRAARSEWKGRILLYLESQDPRLLDKETHKVYLKIRETGVNLQGPIPLPLQRPAGCRDPESPAGLHRRLFRIFIPTEEFIPFLEKLPLSGSVNASFQVEEEDPLFREGPSEEKVQDRKDSTA